MAVMKSVLDKGRSLMKLKLAIKLHSITCMTTTYHTAINGPWGAIIGPHIL